MSKVLVPAKYGRLVYGLISKSGERRCELDGPYKNTTLPWERVLLTPESNLNDVLVYHSALDANIDKVGIDVLDLDGNKKEKVFSSKICIYGVEHVEVTKEGFEITFANDCKCEVVKKFTLQGKSLRTDVRELNSPVSAIFASWIKMQDIVQSVNNRKTKLNLKRSEEFRSGIDLTPDFNMNSIQLKRK